MVHGKKAKTALQPGTGIAGRLRRGDGEFIGFAIIAVILCSLCIYLGSFLMVSSALNSLTKAATAAGRAAAVSADMDEARERAQSAAQSAVTISNAGSVTSEVSYAGDTDSWEAGGYLKVTVSAYVTTMEPLTEGTRSRSVIVCIEGEGAADILNEFYETPASDNDNGSEDDNGGGEDDAA